MSGSQKIIRENIVQLLHGSWAHKPVVEIVGEFPIDKINLKISGIEYTPWQLLEHVRIAQFDILDFIVNPDYKQRNFPDGYWPDKTNAIKEDWEKTKNNFLNDLNKLIKIAEDESTNLFEPIPHAKDYNIYRELILAGNHNAYHLGQMIIFSKTVSNSE